MAKRGTETLIMNQRSSLQEKNKMFIFLNVTTRCSTSKSGNSNQHVRSDLSHFQIYFGFESCA